MLHTRLLKLATLIAILSIPTDISAQGYTLRSLVSGPVGLSVAPFTLPTINNAGQIAYGRAVLDSSDGLFKWIAFIHDGTSAVPIFNLHNIGLELRSYRVIINDRGAVAFIAEPFRTDNACGSGIRRCIVRVQPDGSFDIMATFDPVNGSGDFADLSHGLAFNAQGQVAAHVRRHDGVSQIVRLEGPGSYTVIFTESDTLINPTAPAMNEHGVVAFVALELSTACSGISCQGIYSGTGGALTLEGRRPGGGNYGPPAKPTINDAGLILDTGVVAPALLYSLSGGNVETLVVGNEAHGMAHIQNWPKLNNNGEYVFGTRSAFQPDEFSLFIGHGSTPTANLIIHSDWDLFDGNVHELRTAFDGKYFNDRGQAVFALGVVRPDGGFSSHLVLAEPLDEPSDDDPPQSSILLSPEAPDGANGWYVSPVLISVSASDSPAGSGVIEVRCAAYQGTAPPASFESLPEGCSFLEPGSAIEEDGVYQIAAASRDAAGNVESPVATAALALDRTAPAMSCGPIQSFAQHAENAIVTASATDALSGPASRELTVVADTSVVGTQSIEITASDLAGNVATTTCAYTVVANHEIRFEGGFGGPVDTNGENVVRAGRVIPLKWRLVSEAGPVTNLESVDASSQAVVCGSGEAIGPPEAIVTTGPGLQNLGDGYYQLNWRTADAYAGSCRVVVIRVADGVTLSATFTFE